MKMNPEVFSSEDEHETIKKVPVSDLLAIAGESFDAFGMEYAETHDPKLLVGKKRILEEILVECEEYGEDWNEFKDKITPIIEGLEIEINDLKLAGRFSTNFDRVGYDYGGKDRNVNVLYMLSNACKQKNSIADEFDEDTL